MALFLAIHNGLPGAPHWMTALVLSEKWGIPPWEVYHHPAGALWAARQAAYDEAREKSRKIRGHS